MKDILKIISDGSKYVENSKKFTNNIALIYKIGNGNLLKEKINYFFDNQIMGIYDENFSNEENIKKICDDILFDYNSLNFKGIYLDFNYENSVELVSKLDQYAYRNQIELYVPKAFAKVTNHAKIVIDMGISGGNISDILEYTKMEFGKDRVCAKISYNIRKFIVPNSQDSEGEILLNVDLHDKEVFFSELLCTNYYTTMISEDKCEFVIFDNIQSLYKKIEVLHKVGIKNIFMDNKDLISYNIFN